MKTAIALAGFSNVGKTTTIRFLYEIFSKYPNAKIVEKFRDKHEECFLITINRKTIAFLTGGDPLFIKKFHKLLAEFVARKVQVIVCACRLSGNTMLAVAGLEKKGYDIEWKFCPKLSLKDTDAYNKRRAKKIEKEILRIVGKTHAKRM